MCGCRAIGLLWTGASGLVPVWMARSPDTTDVRLILGDCADFQMTLVTRLLFCFAGITLSVYLPLILHAVTRITSDRELNAKMGELGEWHEHYYPQYIRDISRWVAMGVGLNLCMFAVTAVWLRAEAVSLSTSVATLVLLMIPLHASATLAGGLVVVQVTHLIRFEIERFKYDFPRLPEAGQNPAAGEVRVQARPQFEDVAGIDWAKLTKEYMVLETCVANICDKLGTLLILLTTFVLAWVLGFLGLGLEVACSIRLYIVFGVIGGSAGFGILILLIHFTGQTMYFRNSSVTSPSIRRHVLQYADSIPPGSKADYRALLQYMAMSNAGASVNGVVIDTASVLRLASPAATFLSLVYGYAAERLQLPMFKP